MKLEKNSVHIWSIDTTLHSLPNYLSSDEINRWDRFYFSKDKNTFYHSHNALRIILSHYLSEKPGEIEYTFTAYGKPFLKKSSLQFNLSHTDTMAAVAVTEGAEIGVDIENVNREMEFDTLAQRFFCKAESEKLERLHSSHKRDAFFNCWTRKEAFIKAIGEGLSYPLNQIEVSMLSDEPVQIKHISQNRDAMKEWTLDSRNTSHYRIASAVHRQKSTFESLEFSQLIHSS